MKTIVKGGHLRKTACGIASFAPFMATASTIALGALLATTSPVEAGRCQLQGTPSAANGHVVLCAGEAVAGESTQTVQSSTMGAALSVTDDGTFGLSVSDGKGISVTGGDSGTSVTVDIDGSVSAEGYAIEVNQEGAGAVMVETNGSVTSSTAAGINVVTAEATMGDVSIITGGEITGGTSASNNEGHGIKLDHDGNGVFTITTNDDVTSGNGNGIRVENASDSGGGTINVNGDITANDSASAGIFVQNYSSELVTINLNNGVTLSSDLSNTGNTAISLASPYPSSHIKVSMGDGVSLGGDKISGGGVNGDMILELSGTATGTGNDDDANVFDISGIENSDIIEKTGSGTWTITGTPTPGGNEPFSAAGTSTIRVEEGRLIWDATSQFNEASISVNGPGTFEINSARAWSTDIMLSGRLALTGVSSSLDLDGELASERGEIDIDVDFSGGDDTLSVARVDVSEVSGSPVTVNVRAVDGFPEVAGDDEDGLISIQNFIKAETANADSFRAGRALGGGFAFQLVNVEDGQGQQWTLVAEPGAGGITVYDTFAAVLTQLSQPGTLHERLLNRQLMHNTNVYARFDTSTSEVEPLEAAAFESKTHSLQFGVHAPLLKLFKESWANSVNFDASVEYVLDETEARVEVGSVEIKTEAVAAALGATWESDNAFIDGQVRFANFESDFEYGEEKPADPNATSLTASVEIGYSFEDGEISLDDILGADFVDDVFPGLGDTEVGFDNISIVPSVQISWSGVDYNDYVSTTGTSVRLYDGDTIFGRAGMTAQGDWSSFALQGRVGVSVPIEGEVITEVNGVNVSSELQEVAFDFGLGAAFSLGDYAVTLDASAQQGEEIEGYGGSVGLKYNF